MVSVPAYEISLAIPPAESNGTLSGVPYLQEVRERDAGLVVQQHQDDHLVSGHREHDTLPAYRRLEVGGTHRGVPLQLPPAVLLLVEILKSGGAALKLRRQRTRRRRT